MPRFGTPRSCNVAQKKPGHPVRFELTEQRREAIDPYMKETAKKPGEYLFPSRRFPGRPLTTRQCMSGSSPTGSQGSAWTPASMAPTRCDGLRRPPNRQPPSGAALLGHRKIESTVRYLGIEVDDALAIAEQVDV